MQIPDASQDLRIFREFSLEEPISARRAGIGTGTGAADDRSDFQQFGAPRTGDGSNTSPGAVAPTW